MKNISLLPINNFDSKEYGSFVSEFRSREERHYCAYLFAWLISSEKNLEIFLKNHSNQLLDKFVTGDIQNAKAYFEYTAIRELLDLLGRKSASGRETKENLKNIIENVIFDNTSGDIQKKKPDLVFYFPASKSLLLIEAKFEMGFDEIQITQSQRYGKVLQELFPNQINNVLVSALGIEYYTNKINANCPCISWEKIFDFLPLGKIKTEIEYGLDYQKMIHPKAMKAWKVA
jgi:hypothetical protein